MIEAAAKVGLDRKTYGAHSMRAVFVTAAMLAGISETRIAEHTAPGECGRHQPSGAHSRGGPIAGQGPLTEVRQMLP